MFFVFFIVCLLFISGCATSQYLDNRPSPHYTDNARTNFQSYQSTNLETTDVEKTLYPKVFVGISNNWLSGDNRQIFEGATGFNAGVSVEFKGDRDIFTEMGVRYITRGWGATIKTDRDTYEYTQSSSYLELLLEFKYDVVDDKNKHIEPYIGMSAGLLVSEKASISSQGMIVTRELINNKNNMTTNLLLGVDLATAKSFVIGIEYNRGLLNDRSPSHNNTNAIMLNLGFKL